MKVINLSEHNSVLNQYLREIRDVDIQKDRLRFRRNIERIGEFMAIEVSKMLNYEHTDVQTPLGVAPVFRCIRVSSISLTTLRMLS